MYNIIIANINYQDKLNLTLNFNIVNTWQTTILIIIEGAKIQIFYTKFILQTHLVIQSLFDLDRMQSNHRQSMLCARFKVPREQSKVEQQCDSQLLELKNSIGWCCLQEILERSYLAGEGVSTLPYNRKFKGLHIYPTNFVCRPHAFALVASRQLSVDVVAALGWRQWLLVPYWREQLRCLSEDPEWR